MGTNKTRCKKPNTSMGTTERALVSSGWSLIITLVISTFLLLIATALTMLYEDPTSLADTVGYVCLYVSAFLGGFAASKIEKSVPYLTSLFCGLFFVLLSMLCSIAIPHTFSSGISLLARFGMHTLSLILFPIGTLAGVKGSKKSHKIKKKKH